jgi:hypothetical protein
LILETKRGQGEQTDTREGLEKLKYWMIAVSKKTKNVRRDYVTGLRPSKISKGSGTTGKSITPLPTTQPPKR